MKKRRIIARHPILDKKQRILAYEIFYRSGFVNVYTGRNHDEATLKVIVDTFGRGPYKDLGALVLAYEQGQWDKVQICAQKLDLQPETVAQAYLQALEWCPQSF
ncbi:MAG TPA: hypothetical protein DDZ66_06890 [Firmicutes bacterium]|nr:hypothetical protein [Bacillota bacterium]